MADATGDAAEPRFAVVTGASAGIGRAIAQALGALGWPVALGARRIDQLDETDAANGFQVNPSDEARSANDRFDGFHYMPFCKRNTNCII